MKKLESRAGITNANNGVKVKSQHNIASKPCPCLGALTKVISEQLPLDVCGVLHIVILVDTLQSDSSYDPHPTIIRPHRDV